MSGKLMRATVVAAAGMLCVGAASSTVYAQGTSQSDKEKAIDAYRKGTTQYNLGNWDRAVTYFKQAFELYPDAAFLFNIAQSYRQKGDCKQGSFFYKRYLAIKPKAPNRSEVEGFIRDLDEACQKQEANSDKKPIGPMNPDNNNGTDNSTDADVNNKPDPKPDNTNNTADNATDNTTDNSTDTADNTTDNTTDNSTTDNTQVADASTDGNVSKGLGDKPPSLLDEPEGPGLLVATAHVGTSFLSMGNLETSPQASFSIGAGYPIALGKMILDVGANVSFTAVNWESEISDGTAGFTSLLANAGITYPVMDKINVRGELGAGAFMMSGLDVIGNVFVPEGEVATGALGSFNFRAALAAEYSLSDNLAVNVAPIVMNVAAAPDGLIDDIGNISAFQMLLGVGYKM